MCFTCDSAQLEIPVLSFIYQVGIVEIYKDLVDDNPCASQLNMVVHNKMFHNI